MKSDTPSELTDLYRRIVTTCDSYTELSRSGLGVHILVRGNIGPGCKKDGVEIYSQERFIICTGNVWIDRPLVDRQDMLNNMVSQMRTVQREVALEGVDRPDAALAAEAALDAGEMGRLFRGDWQGRQYPSQSEADLALVKLLLPKCGSTAECWATFRLSKLGQRAKAARADYARKTIGLAVQHLSNDSDAIQHGKMLAEGLLASTEQGGEQEPVPKADSPAFRTLFGRSLGGVQPRAIEWLWTGWIPKGYITIFAGETGAGKSTVLADITARVTTGAPWPGEGLQSQLRPRGRVLWLGSEDSIEEMTVPRLMACGADLNNVIELMGVTHAGKRDTFSMQDDIVAVGHWLDSAKTQGPPFVMLVIDPVTSYLHGGKLKRVDLNDAGQLRTVLEPWLVLAQEHQIAIVCVTHFAKDTNRAMLHRVLGSAAFAQTCRSLCAVVEPPSTEEYEPGPYEKAMIQVKTNLPEHPGGAWKFATEKVEVAVDERNGKPITATRPNWGELDSALTAKTAVGPARGPKSQQEPQFALWLNLSVFGAHPPGTWLSIDHVKRTAIAFNIVTESWWNKHSSEHLEKRNDAGTWKCRPRTAPTQ